MGLIDSLNSWVKSKIVGWLQGEYDTAYTARANSLVKRREYRLGAQARFLRKSREGYDDNIVSNFLGLALDPELWFGESYMMGRLDVRGSLEPVVEALTANSPLQPSDTQTLAWS